LDSTGICCLHFRCPPPGPATAVSSPFGISAGLLVHLQLLTPSCTTTFAHLVPTSPTTQSKSSKNTTPRSPDRSVSLCHNTFALLTSHISAQPQPVRATAALRSRSTLPPCSLQSRSSFSLSFFLLSLSQTTILIPVPNHPNTRADLSMASTGSYGVPNPRGGGATRGGGDRGGKRGDGGTSGGDGGGGGGSSSLERKFLRLSSSMASTYASF
jgi:uncharacterized membrane protein YgcG